MANKQIKDLTLKSNPATDDQLAIDESGGSTKKITVGSLPGENNRTLDAVPTDGNTANSVSSDGVFDALAGKSDTTHNHDSAYSATGHSHSKLDYLTVTQAVDLDTLESDTATNNAKTGITSEQASAITANTAKTGITSGQASAITANTAHSGSTSNPHSVTATQVGLGNVDNTSDADKPVSTAQATADALALPKAGGTMTGALDFGDNVKANFGASDDLQIYHDGSNSYIDDSGTGYLRIRGTTYVSIGSTSGEDGLIFQDNAGVKLNFDNSQKLATTSTGINVTGDTTTDSLTVQGAITEQETTKDASFTPFDLSTDGTIFDIEGVAATTITVTMPAVTAGKSFTVIFDDVGTLAWGTTPAIKWSGGSPPTGTGVRIFSFISNGSFWYGMEAGSAFA